LRLGVFARKLVFSSVLKNDLFVPLSIDIAVQYIPATELEIRREKPIQMPMFLNDAGFICPGCRPMDYQGE
jgi:hypothetical protein